MKRFDESDMDCSWDDDGCWVAPKNSWDWARSDFGEFLEITVQGKTRHFYNVAEEEFGDSESRLWYWTDEEWEAEYVSWGEDPEEEDEEWE